MIYPSDISKLISEWTERMGNTTYPQPYRDALAECAYELGKILTDFFEEEINAREYLEQQKADSYWASIEAHEKYA